MSSKKWLLLFILTIALIFLGLLAFNYAVDPFGVFGSRIFSWPSYEMTLNPRTAKITYLESGGSKKNYENYDSYIIGCSSTSSYPVDALNECFNAKFYNLIMYGADMLDVEQTATYICNNFTVKNLFVNIYVDNAIHYDTLPNPLSYEMPAKVSGASKLGYYLKYLVMDPRYSIDKIKAKANDTILPQYFDVFNAETGCYDKSVRDVEHISDIDSYYVAYPEFSSYPVSSCIVNEEAVNGTVESLRRIKNICDKKGINLIVANAPVYYDYYNDFDQNALKDFYSKIAEVTPYYDFSISSVSFEPRYFYDTTHFRNCVGRMAIAYIAGNDDIYRPGDFGAYVDSDNIDNRFEIIANTTAKPIDEYTKNVPVLMYHETLPDDAVQGDVSISETQFRNHMKALYEAGYNTITTQMLESYVINGTELPDKPVLITFDDGYLSNYNIAFPILKEYNMSATIFVIGSGVGHEEYYKDTEYPITPRFDFEAARDMLASGLISIQSHTYDMHQYAPYEEKNPRTSITRLKGETDEDFRKAILNDSKIMRSLLKNELDENVTALSYPGGVCDTLANVTLSQIGYSVTFGEPIGSNTVIKGMPQSLLQMNRFSINHTISSEKLIQIIG